MTVHKVTFSITTRCAGSMSITIQMEGYRKISKNARSAQPLLTVKNVMLVPALNVCKGFRLTRRISARLVLRPRSDACNVLRMELNATSAMRNSLFLN